MARFVKLALILSLAGMLRVDVAPAELVSDCGVLRSEGDCHYFDGFQIGTYSLERVDDCDYPDTVFVWGWTNGETDCAGGIATLGDYFIGETCTPIDWGCGTITECDGQTGCLCVEMESGLRLDLVDWGQWSVGDRISVVGYPVFCWMTWCGHDWRIIPSAVHWCPDPTPVRTRTWGQVKSVYR